MALERNKVTLKDVADYAGVSPATISLVIHGKGNLREEIRSLVEKAIEETGYSWRSAQKRPQTGIQFALVVDDIANPYFHLLYKGLDRVLGDAGHFATLLSSQDSVERQSQLLENLWNSDVGGVVLVPATGTTRESLRHLEGRRRPLMTAVRRLGPSCFDYVGANPMVGMQIAVDHLIGLGHSRIGFIGGYQANFAYGERYAGFVASLMKRGTKVQDRWVKQGGSTRDFGYEAARRLLSEPDRPTALVGYNDLVAIGMMDALRAAGLQAGRDMSIIGHDDIPEAALQPVPLTSVATPAMKLGEVIGHALATKLTDGTAESPLDITYPPRLVVRASCGHALAQHHRDGDMNDNTLK